MLFNSFEFLLFFLPISFAVYFSLTAYKLKTCSQLWLVASSLFFYSWWNPIYLPIILVSMIGNYWVGHIFQQDHHLMTKTSKKIILILSITANLLLLAYFKYLDFFISNSNWALGTSFNTFDLALPLAISFFTFQQIAYLVDSYQGQTKSYSFTNYAVFVSFFPQLIAGPIVHHKEMMPQFADKSNLSLNSSNIMQGLFILAIGLFKKVILADTFAVWANEGFANSEQLSTLDAWLCSLSYTFQLYFDFSGYSDMALGIALLFNIKLPANFNSPYKALSIQDFWRRWHITLSRFLRDYIYIPLGGNKKGSFRTCSNLMVTFLLGGLWHGAGWTFIFWGFLHGAALIIHRVWNQAGLRMNKLLAWFITFNFVNIAWVYFRAENWQQASNIISAMFSWQLSVSINTQHVVYILIGLAIAVFAKNSLELPKSLSKSTKHYVTAFSLTAGLLHLGYFMLVSSADSEFLYFNF